MADFVSRGFGGRRRTGEELAARVPPGQYVETGFPVLTAGPTPHVDTAEWTLKLDGMVANELEWSWEEFQRLPFEEVPWDLTDGKAWVVTEHEGEDLPPGASQAFDSGLAFVCGSNSFVEAATALLLEAGYGPGAIRTERFGPTG